MRRRVLLFSIVVGTLTLFSQHAVCQDTKKKPKVADAAIDLAVPDSPAFTVLGLSPNDVARPASPREFATSLINGIDANGNFQTGIAIEGSPYMLIKGAQTTLKDYQDNYEIRFASRTQVSFATAKGSSNADKAVRLALGFTFTPWDEGDPRTDTDFLECLRGAVATAEISKAAELEAVLDQRNHWQKKLRQAQIDGNKKEMERLEPIVKNLEEQADELLNAGTTELNEKSAKAIEACRNNERFRTNYWNGSSFALGVAPTWTSTSGETEDFKYTGTALWSSLALRIGGSAQFIFHTRYRSDEQVPDENVQGDFFEQDSILIGGRFRFGKPSVHGTIEGMYIYKDRKDGREDDQVFQYRAGAEYKVSKDFWIALSIGSESGSKDGDEVSVLGNLKWILSPEPTQKF